MKKKNLFALLSSLLALALEITPWGAVLNFALDDGETIRKTYSYFSMIPFGYANFFPLMTAIMTCLLVLFLLIALIRKSEKAANTAFFLSLGGAVISLLPLLYGVRAFSLTGLGITLCLAVSALLLFRRELMK